MPAAFPVFRFLARVVPALAGAAFVVLLSAGAVSAAPQVLGLVADNGFPTPLTCDEFECSAQFSSFCLQEGRSSPPTGSAYTPAPGGVLSLVATTPDGRSLRLPAAQSLRIATAIGFTSVSMSLPRSERDRIAATLGAAPEEIRLAVEIGPAVSLLPVPVAGDPDPQTAEEVTLAIGPLRQIAESLFESPSATADAARLTTQLINSLPARGRETVEARDSLFEQVASLPATSTLSPDGIERAEALYAECRISVESSSMFSMRECLRLRHADLMVHSNRAFWQQAGGS